MAGHDGRGYYTFWFFFFTFVGTVLAELHFPVGRGIILDFGAVESFSTVIANRFFFVGAIVGTSKELLK